MDQSSLNRFLTLYEWDEELLNRRRLELLWSMEETRWREEGVVVIDNTLLPKTGEKMPGAGRLWDPNSGRYVHAQCLVTSHYVDLEKEYPVGYRQYFKHGSREAREHGFRSKVELVDECERLGVAAENYVFDAWYLSKGLTSHIEGHGKGWVSRLKANRIVYHEGRRTIKAFERALPRKAFREVRMLDKTYWVHTQVLDVNKLGKVRVVICYGNKDLRGAVYLATNRLYWEEVRVVQCYSLRFRIDTFYKDVISESLVELIEHSLGKVLICVENDRLSGIAMEVLEELLPTANLSLCWDIPKSHTDAGKPNPEIENFYMRHLDRVRECHLHGQKPGEHPHNMLGVGNINLYRYLKLLVPRNVNFTLEIRPRENTLKSLKILKDMLAKIGWNISSPA